VQAYTLRLSTDREIGSGSFGTVYEARIVETGEVVAIKRVLQDKRFKVRNAGGIASLRGRSWRPCEVGLAGACPVGLVGRAG
jgi:hypothetical protein